MRGHRMPGVRSGSHNYLKSCSEGQSKDATCRSVSRRAACQVTPDKVDTSVHDQASPRWSCRMLAASTSRSTAASIPLLWPLPWAATVRA